MGRPSNTVPRIEKLYVNKTESCWEWMASLDKDGYSKTKIYGKHVRGHRAFYEHYVGAIGNGLQIDHICRNRRCVNPMHLEPVSPLENTMRGNGQAAKKSRQVKCIKNHELNGGNLYITPDGRRQCKECQKLRSEVYRAHTS